MQRIGIISCNLLHYIYNNFLSSVIDLTPNCDNTRDLHPSLRGNVNLEVTLSKFTETTITVLMYTLTSGGISFGKDFEVQMLSSDFWNGGKLNRQCIY